MRASRPHALVALLTALLLGCCTHLARAATTGAALSPDDTYTVNTASGAVVLAPSVGWNASLIRLLPAQEVAGCASACRADAQCMLFNHCDLPAGCNGTAPTLRYQDCQLLAMPCTAVPVAGVAGPWIKRTAGFPVRYQAPQTPGFAALQAEGVAGSDMQCDGSVLPGRCAFASVDAAVQACSGLPDCSSVVIYFLGVDGCSNLTAVLVSAAVPLSAAAFVSPTVALLTKDAGGGGGGGGSSSSSLSAGAIAGIAVGAVAGAAALAGLAWVLLRRRGAPANGQQTVPSPGKAFDSAEISNLLRHPLFQRRLTCVAAALEVASLPVESLLLFAGRASSSAALLAGRAQPEAVCRATLAWGQVMVGLLPFFLSLHWWRRGASAHGSADELAGGGAAREGGDDPHGHAECGRWRRLAWRAGRLSTRCSSALHRLFCPGAGPQCGGGGLLAAYLLCLYVWAGSKLAAGLG